MSVHSSRSRIVGESVALRRQLATLEEFARADAPVHIYGETGTGKELVARAIHGYSSRATKRFVAQNCASVPDTLLQSLLFGHRRGAFTGADRDQIGVFEAADGGSLLLDEVAEMSSALQGSLLRVLQDGEVTRLGEVEARRVDVRVISATNRDLERDMTAGRFRKDLYFRLVTLRVDLPPLRERDADVALLAAHFLDSYNARTGKRIAGFEPDALACLDRYAWPGNIRQLEAEIERACILTAPGATIGKSTLSAFLRDGAPMCGTAMDVRCQESLTSGATLPEILGECERALLAEAMERGHGNKTRAAEILGVSRQRLSQRLRRWRMKETGDQVPGRG